MKYLVLIAAFALMGSAAGWAGEQVWSPVAMTLAIVLGLATSALFAYRRQQADPQSGPWFSAIVWGAILGAGLWVAGVQLWGFNDFFLNSNLLLGEDRIWSKSILGVALGIGLGLIVAAHVRQPKHRWARSVRRIVLAGWLVLLLTAFVLYMTRTGVENTDLYPLREQSPYLLPWPEGITRVCTQGNRAIISHRDPGELYAFDFAMPIGSPISAAREGVVISADDEHDGNGLEKPANYIIIRHSDSSFAMYAHIRQFGSRVKKGEYVRQGQIIAESGNVGFSTSPHLHFHVYVLDAGWRSIPITFRDVTIRSGIPRMWLRYTSGNAVTE